MFAASVQSDGNDDLRGTEPAAPSEDEPTRTAASAIEQPPSPPTTSTRLRDPARYQILGEHGRGGLGRVSRAHDRELGRDVAIKELISRGHVSEVRFLREALITARLEHPGIVPVHEAGRWPDGTPFYAMKLVSGRSLRELIAERTSVDERLGLLHHVIAVADAIAYAHGRNIIHRDLKPANVIVGDFGETVVIDWGLAKDLTAFEESSVGGGPFRTSRDEDLTATGAVLGTPTYMAPEQERGEPVDQRADVFAIGAMLWQLCSLHKVPPAEPRSRHDMLRRTGIDEDLAMIIDKSLDPDPKRRYRDAGALAADLKAFNSGARIAARNYSLLAMLGHWIRRHRAIALAAAAMITFSTGGSAFYVRSIALERDRANRSEAGAKRARTTAEASLEDLKLKHAQLLLTTDPSATIESLAKYRGLDVDSAAQIRAEAIGRGVALLRVAPHTGNVLWTHGAPGNTIMSLSTDGTIKRTSFDGGSVTLSRDVAQIGLSAYSDSRRLLAYACDPADVCLLDTRDGSRLAVDALLRDLHPVGLSFSPDASLLGVMSEDGVLTIVEMADPARPRLRLRKKVNDGIDVKFLDNNTIAAGTNAGLEFVSMDGRSEAVTAADSSHWDASAALQQFALATTRGEAFVFEPFQSRKTVTNQLCAGPIVGLRFIPGRRSVAYACRTGAVGIWDLQHNKVRTRIQLEGHAELITVDTTGEYILVAADRGAVMVLDLKTEIVTLYKGHGFRLTHIAPPSEDGRFLISADVQGAIRAWPLPLRFSRVMATAKSPFHTALVDEYADAVIATTLASALVRLDPGGVAEEIGPHESSNIILKRSGSGAFFATYGLRDLVEIWSLPSMTRIHLIDTGHGSISHLAFIDQTDDFVTSGHDGRLVRWTMSGSQALIAKFDKAIKGLAVAHGTESLVFSTDDGALWRTNAGNDVVLVKDGGIIVNQLYSNPDDPTVYVGYANGDMIALSTRTWQHETVLRAPGAIREIASINKGTLLAAASSDGTIQIGRRHGEGSGSLELSWTRLPARARRIVFTRDGLLIAACVSGIIWIYDTVHRRWSYLIVGATDLRDIVVTSNGKSAAVVDTGGNLLWIDLESARKYSSSTDVIGTK